MTKKDPSYDGGNPKRPRYSKVELYVLKEDVDLLREVAAALSDPARENETRAVLQEQIPRARPGRLKELLASMSFDEGDLSRTPATNRDEAP